MNILNAILLKLGFVPIQQLIESKEERNFLMDKLNKKDEECKTLKSIIELDPYDFDELISKYTNKEINAFMYKVINECRNNPNRGDLLERWKERAINALETKNDGKEDLSN